MPLFGWVRFVAAPSACLLVAAMSLMAWMALEKLCFTISNDFFIHLPTEVGNRVSDMKKHS